MASLAREIIEFGTQSIQAVRHYSKRRFAYHEFDAELNSQSRSLFILSGPRGAGKTILLKQLIADREGAFYLSVDQLKPDESLFQIAEALEKNYRVRYLILDEIHHNQNYAADLKKIYDTLGLKVLVTSSISLKLGELSHDLSRRAKLFHLYPFSFREFVYFEKDILLRSLTFDEIIKQKWDREHLGCASLFHEYLFGRLYPFTLDETNAEPLFKNILEKTLTKDIPILGGLAPAEVFNIEKMLAHIARSPSEGISYNSLSKNIGISKSKAEEYAALLARAYLIHVLLPNGTNVMREPKILLHLPYRILYKPKEEVMGGLREDFVAETLKAQGYFSLSYLKGTRGEKTPDFLIEVENGRQIVIEVGGKGKGRSQFKGIKVKEKIILVDSLEWKDFQRPLFMLGMLGS